MYVYYTYVHLHSPKDMFAANGTQMLLEAPISIISSRKRIIVLKKATWNSPPWFLNTDNSSNLDSKQYLLIQMVSGNTLFFHLPNLDSTYTGLCKSRKGVFSILRGSSALTGPSLPLSLEGSIAKHFSLLFSIQMIKHFLNKNVKRAK